MEKHSIEMRVRYEETDQMGVVYYGNYLTWFEVARTEFFRDKNVEYRKMEDEKKIFIPVVEAYCRYKAPLRYDDLITVTTELTEFGATKMSFSYEIKKGDKICAVGNTKHAFVNKKGVPIKIPPEIKKAIS